MERYVIHVTKKCNMACSYCYEEDRVSTYTWEEIEELCFNIINLNRNGEHYSIEFLGGEPCLAFDYIKKAVKLFKENDHEHCDYFIITTNGTILNNDIADFLRKNPDVCFSISLDGTKEANSRRVLKASNINSYDVITYNIKCLLKLYEIPYQQLSVHMVTHPFNVKLMYESVKDIYNMGIRSISMGTIESTMALSESYRDRYILEMKKIANSILSGTFKDLYIDIFESFDTEKPKGRIYIRDKNGKMICESYAQAINDITNTDVYDSTLVGSNVSEFIFNMRREACLYYREEKRKCSIQKYQNFG